MLLVEGQLFSGVVEVSFEHFDIGSHILLLRCILWRLFLFSWPGDYLLRRFGVGWMALRFCVSINHLGYFLFQSLLTFENFVVENVLFARRPRPYFKLLALNIRYLILIRYQRTRGIMHCIPLRHCIRLKVKTAVIISIHVL